MGLLGLLLSAYFILLLVRALVPDTGQMAFNQPYRLVVKLTEPVIAFAARLLPPRFRRLAALLAIGFLILLHGVLFMRGTGPGAGVYTWGFIRWSFLTGRPFWGLGAGLAHYLVLTYRLFVFLVLIVLISPGAAPDQVSRLIRSLLQPLLTIARDRRATAAVLPLLFTAAMTVLWRLYRAAGWLAGEGPVLGRALVNSLVLPLQLATVIVYLIFFRALLSWFQPDRRSAGAFAWLELFVEPFLRPFRRLNLVLGTIDLTPLAAIFAILIGRRILETILFQVFQAV